MNKEKQRQGKRERKRKTNTKNVRFVDGEIPKENI